MRFEITFRAASKSRESAIVAEYNSDTADILVYGFGVNMRMKRILTDSEVREVLEREARDFAKRIGVVKIDVINIMRQRMQSEV